MTLPERRTGIGISKTYGAETIIGPGTGASNLDPALAALSKAIVSKNRQEAMHRSNEITSTAADLAEPFHPAVPVDINRLDFYGRALEVVGPKNRTG